MYLDKRYNRLYFCTRTSLCIIDEFCHDFLCDLSVVVSLIPLRETGSGLEVWSIHLGETGTGLTVSSIHLRDTGVHLGRSHTHTTTHTVTQCHIHTRRLTHLVTYKRAHTHIHTVGSGH